MSKRKRQPANSSANQLPKPTSAGVEMVLVPTAPKRDGFSMADFRSSLKQAESVENPSRIKLLDYYNDILIDLHLTGVIEKRRNNIRSTKFTFVDEKGGFNEAIDNLINTPKWREMLVDILDAQFFGYTAGWLDLSGGQLIKYDLLPRKHIVPEKTLFLKRQTDRDGIDYSQGTIANYIVTAGKRGDLGLLLKAIPWVLLKRGDVSDWATFNELYAEPFRIGKYPQYDQVAQKALAEACRDFTAFGFAVIPNTTSLEFVQAQASASTEAYEKFAEFCDKQLSKGFVLNTMTLDAEGGNYKGEVHQNSENSVFAADRCGVLDVLNTRVLALLELHGFNPGKGYFSVEEEDHICLKDRIGIDKEVATHIEIPAEYWYTKYRIPFPKGGPKAKVATPEAKLSEVDALRAEIMQLRADQEQRTMDIEPRPRSFFGQAPENGGGR